MAERKKAAKKKGYKMPPPIPPGEVLTDAQAKKKWRIGPSIGVGGFGEIYSASDEDVSAPKSSTENPYVVKIEPSENGPLFVEKHFYSRNANKDDISEFMRARKLTSLGMPRCVGGGSHQHAGHSLRYLVLERYGQDLWTIFKDCGRRFPAHTVFQIGLQMLDVLEYIHLRGYVHADLKGANMLLGRGRGEQQVYLLDYGLAKRVTDGPFKPDPRCAHNGTIEYTSRDAHLGVPTMRGDLEILAYNMLQWTAGDLPWETQLQDPARVHRAKEDFFNNLRTNIKKHYPQVPEALIEFFEYVKKLEPKELPDYTKCKKIFETFLKAHGRTRTSKLDFSDTPTPKTTKKTTKTAQKADGSDKKVARTTKATKRKSSDSLRDATVKKTKQSPQAKATPPAKVNHVNISTQTSAGKTSAGKRKSPRAVQFDSPVVTQTIAYQSNGRRGRTVNYSETSPDMFDDSFEGNSRRKAPGAGRTKARSWRDAPAVINGKRPPAS